MIKFSIDQYYNIYDITDTYIIPLSYGKVSVAGFFTLPELGFTFLTTRDFPRMGSYDNFPNAEYEDNDDNDNNLPCAYNDDDNDDNFPCAEYDDNNDNNDDLSYMLNMITPMTMMIICHMTLCEVL